MTLQELRYLVALAEEGHFSRAAEVCHVGQPTLSTQLKKLEDYLSVQLFERSHRGLMPTPIGEEIIEQARIALEVMEKIRELARHGRDPMSGSLRLGVIPTVGPYFVPPLLPKIRSAFPRLRLFVKEDLTAHLLEDLRTGRLDVLLLAIPVQGEGLNSMELYREPFVAALPAGHPLTRKQHIRELDLTGECVLLLEEGHCLRDQALEICGAARSPESDQVTAGSLETLRQMVAAGIGCTLLPALAVAPGVGCTKNGSVEIRCFTDPAPSRAIGLVWRRRYPREETVRQLSRLIRADLPAAVSRSQILPFPKRVPLPETQRSSLYL
ncbi:MAG: LysR substrate-binding domain-containing protein [Burkholderiales bacterium]